MAPAIFASPDSSVAPSEAPARPHDEGAGPHPGWVAAVAAAAAIAFVVLRLLVHDGDITAFVRAGADNTDPRAESELTVVEGSGYDGQFSHRLARSPLSTADRVDGTGFDRSVDRQARIGYPALAWAASLGGRAPLVPWALVGVNVAAIATVAGMAALLARDVQRSTWWGLLPALSPGLVVALSRDLTEAVAAATLLVALVLLRRRRLLAATGVLVAAALTRETTLVVPLAIGGSWLLHVLPGGGPAWATRVRSLVAGDGERTVPIWVGVVPLAAYVAWRGYLSTAWDAPTDFGADAPTNGLGIPFVEPLLQALRFAREAGDVVQLVQLVQLVLVAAVVVFTVQAAATPSEARGHERLAIGAALALLVSLSVWDRAVVFLRYPSDLIVLGAAVVPAAGAIARRVRNAAVPLMAISTLMWLAVA